MTLPDDNPMLGEDYAAALLKARQEGYADASEYYMDFLRLLREILLNKDGRLSPSDAFDRMHIEMVLMQIERELGEDVE
jgi:hypothetical protein